MAAHQKSQSRSTTRRTERPTDPDNEQDWSGYWYRRVFGKTRFTAGEIMDLGREFRLAWINLLTLYFEYMWDEEINKRREIQAMKEEAAARAEEYVDGHYDIWLDGFAQGVDLYEESIEFDSRLNWASEGGR